MANNKLLVSALIVILFIGGLIFLVNKMPAKTAEAGDLVSVNYTGKLADGTVFDSNVDSKFGHQTPFEFVLGAKQVIPGWETGIMGMKVGEKKQLVIPPDQAYGAAGIPNLIPPNSTLYFDVELLEIKQSYF